MPKFNVYATVTGSKYIGEFEAETKEDAIDQAELSGGAYVSLCHQCSAECEDPEAHNFVAEEA
jgi:hypothetical protein